LHDLVAYALLGLGAGAVYSLLGLGLVVVHRSSGILNFAVGSQAMVGAFLWHDLRGAGLSQPVAVIVAVLASAALGVVVQMLVMGPLRRRAPLVRITAALSLLLLLQSGASLYYGTDTHLITSFLPSHSIRLFGTDLGVDRLWLAGIAVVITVVLGLAYHVLLGGRATEAMAANPRLAASLGWSPGAIGAANWAIGSALAGLAGILISSFTHRLDVNSLTLLILPALAVAMVAGFRSFTLTLVAGIALGVAESEIANYVTGVQGATQALPLLVIVAMLSLGGSGVPQRDFAHDALPAVGRGRLGPVPLAIGAVLAVGAIVLLPVDWVDATTRSMTTAMLLVSIVVVTGYAGQVSLAQFAIAGVGAYGAGRLVAAHGWPLEAGLLAGVGCAVVVGVLFGLPALRARGMTLAVMTLGLGEALYATVFTNSDYTGRLNGTAVRTMTLLGVDVDPVTHIRRWSFVCAIALGVAIFVAGRVRNGRAGRRLLSVRENERAAAALGVNVTAAKLYAFAVASGIAGLAGALIGFTDPRPIQYAEFDPFTSISLVAFAVLAGIGYLSGQPLVALFGAGGGVGSLVLHKLSIDTNWIVLASAAATLVALLAMPDGMVAAMRLPRWARVARHATTTPAEADTAESTTRPLAASLVRRSARGADLELSDVTVRFGGVTALDRVSFRAPAGEVTGLIGPNGAGKTTLIDVASGFVRASSGTVTLGGRDLTRATRHSRARAGLSRSFQSLELFDDLTVRENLLAAADDRDGRAYLTNLVRSGSRDLPEAAQEAVAVFGLDAVLEQRPSEMSYGQRRLVAIARAAASGPAALLLDEPAAGLGRDQTDELAELITVLARDFGQAVVLVEHDLQFVQRVCQHLTVLDQGRLLATGTPAEVVALDSVRAAYLGSAERVHSSAG
jgi:sulfate-transporting ATPase